MSMKILCLLLLLAVQQTAAKRDWGVLTSARSRLAWNTADDSRLAPLFDSMAVRGGADVEASDSQDASAATELYLPGLLETHIVRQPGVSPSLRCEEARSKQVVRGWPYLTCFASTMSSFLLPFRLQSRHLQTAPSESRQPKPRNSVSTTTTLSW